MSVFAPVATLDDLDSLDQDEIFEGFLSAERGDPEPGENRGRAFWHGWRCRMMDYGVLQIDASHRKLVHDWLTRQRSHAAGLEAEAAKKRGGKR